MENLPHLWNDLKIKPRVKVKETNKVDYDGDEEDDGGDDEDCDDIMKM